MANLNTLAIIIDSVIPKLEVTVEIFIELIVKLGDKQN